MSFYSRKSTRAIPTAEWRTEKIAEWAGRTDLLAEWQVQYDDIRRAFTSWYDLIGSRAELVEHLDAFVAARSLRAAMAMTNAPGGEVEDWTADAIDRRDALTEALALAGIPIAEVTTEEQSEVLTV